MNRRKMSLITLVAALAVGTAATAHAEPKSALQDDADRLLTQGAPGVLVKVDDAGHTTKVRSGYGDLAAKTPMPWNAEFRIGSFTKTFVATVLLQLVGEGRLSLGDTVGHWLPGVVTGNGNDGDKITVRELLNHTSGLPEYASKLDLFTARGFGQNRFTTLTVRRAVALAMTMPPDFAPGTDWAYSNTNYMVAGLIIERITGRSWQDEVRDRIIRPLGLRDTFAPDTSPVIPRPHAVGYQQFTPDGPVVDATEMNPSIAGPSGGMISSADDGNRFLRALIQGRLLPPDLMAQMETTVPTRGPESLPGLRDGLGIFWLANSCGGEWTHPGGIQGFQTYDAVSPDGTRGVMVSTNGFVAPPGPLPGHNLAFDVLDHALCD